MSIPLPVSLLGVRGRKAGPFDVLTIADPHDLVQVIGWLKYRSAPETVVYRGQTALCHAMTPSGLRGVDLHGRSTLARALRIYTDLIAGECLCPNGPHNYGQAHLCLERTRRSSPIVRGTHRAAVEPLLQHYGLATRWLDVVDNVWVALWFACHEQVTRGRFAYHQRRSPDQESAGFAYIAVIRTGELSATTIPGYFVGSETRLVDLRYAVPSVYLRPHAQHGLLVAPAKLPDADQVTLTPQVVAYLEVHLGDALAWLGSGMMASSFVFFPPAVRDEGYRRLLDLAPPPRRLGNITEYGAGT